MKRQALDIVEVLRSTSREEILPFFRCLSQDEIFAKSHADDLVTVADRAAEARLTDAFHQLFPDALIVGEEAVAADPAILDDLPEADLAVIIDPVDGTWNFAHGLATFGVIIGICRKGVPVAGYLYDPCLDDCVYAEAGEGAWYLRKNTPRALRPYMGSGEIKGTLCNLWGFPEGARANIANILGEQGRIHSVGSSCQEYRSVALGSFSTILSNHSAPWDHLAGAVVLQELGGGLLDLEGAPYKVGASGVLIGDLNLGRAKRTAAKIMQVLQV